MNDPFLNILPKLDLHGETRDTAPFLIDDFVQMNRKLGNSKVVIIHGRNGTVLKKLTGEVLKRNPNVSKYYIYGLNDGVTIAEIKPHVELL